MHRNNLEQVQKKLTKYEKQDEKRIQNLENNTFNIMMKQGTMISKQSTINGEKSPQTRTSFAAAKMRPKSLDMSGNISMLPSTSRTPKEI